MNGVAKGPTMWSFNEDDYPQPREALIRANSSPYKVAALVVAAKK